MREITEEFETFKVNDQIDLQVKPGEIHTLLGKSGADKSTLMNILSGLLEPTSGEIYMSGERVNITSPTATNRLGIGMVHQHFMLVEAFTVTENTILDNKPTHGGILDRKKAEREIEEVSKQYGLDVDPNAYIHNTSVGMQQRVEVLETLCRGTNVLISDEPTAVLTPQEIDGLIIVLEELTDEGKSIVLITHRLDETKKVVDRCTVIRRGQSIGTVNVKDVSSQRLADMMVGRSASFKTEKKPTRPKGTILSVKDLVVREDRGLDTVKGLSLDVRAGEVVRIAGIDGNGQTELIQALVGLTKVGKGSIHLNEKEITNRKPREVTEMGVAHVPKDRHKYGLVLEMTLAENIDLQTYYQKPYSSTDILDCRMISKHTHELTEEYDVRTPNELVPARALSGGNQQRAIVARKVDRDPDLLIVSQPIRDLDVGAVEYIRRRLIERRDRGKAALLVSFGLDEVLNVPDRITVIHTGEIVGIVDPKEATENGLSSLMTGYLLEEAHVELSKVEAGETAE